MDDPFFDHRSAKRFDRQRASGPFGVDEILPKKIAAWINKKHPETQKKQVLLNFVDWQRGQAARIIADFELHVYEWTLTTVKYRESLDKQDKRDIAQSIFARDRNGRLVPLVHDIRNLTLEQDEDDEQAAAAAQANLPLFQRNALEELFANEATEDDRPVLETCLEMTQTEFSLLETLIRVYDHARSHFIYEVCDPSVKRFLNATRIRYEENGDRMSFELCRSTLLDRMQNSSVLDGLISYVLKPRENGCTLSLWAAERVAERRLLNDDGIEMSEDTWLELILAFVTAEEKQILRVPARDQRPQPGDANAYTVTTLQAALALCDSNNFKRFHQANCLDPVAVRVIALEKLSSSVDPRPRRPPRAEINALDKTPGKPSGAAKGDKAPMLPQKGGSPDKELLATFPEKSLRRRLWDAISSRKCVRCNGDHLRSACPKDRQAWEDDFERPDFWTRKFTPPTKPKQARVQLASSINQPCLKVLHIRCSAGMCLIDTCSDVSIARRDVLTSLRQAEAEVVISHLGGETNLGEFGTFDLEPHSTSPVTLCNVFAVDAGGLPAGVVALIGVSDVARLGLSLDRIAARPGCLLEEARPLNSMGSVLSCLSGFCSRVSRLFRCTPQGERSQADARLHLELQERTEARRRPASPQPEAPLPGSPGGGISNEFLRRFRPTLEEIKTLHTSQQQARTRARIARLYAAPPPARAKKSLHPRSPSLAHQSSSAGQPTHPHPRSHSLEALEPLMPRRGKSKFYGVRVGRQIGVFDSWDKCRSMVDGVSNSEYRSFPTYVEAARWVSHSWKEHRMNMMNLSSALAPMSFRGGRALRAVLHVLQEGETQTYEHICCLDSGSDVNLASRHLLHDVRQISSEAVLKNVGDDTKFTEEGTLKILVSGTIRCIPALVATKAQRPHECEVLLGVPGVDDLGVQLDEHRDKQMKPLECFVGEKTLRTWLDTNGAKEVVKVSFDVSEVQINPEIPDAMQLKIRELLAEYADVFAGEQDSLPKPFATEPVELKFVENPEPQSIPEPRWTHAQKQILTAWAEEGLKNGSLELSTSRWASRPHIVMKTPAHTHKDLVDIGKCKLRVCGDYRQVNLQIVKIVPNLPNGLEEVEKAAGHEYYWETDAVACYSQFVLARGRSREALAVWTPIGLVQPTTLPFGQRNSGTEAQGPYRAAASEMSKGRHGNYVDDWVGYANNLGQLFEDFAIFLRVCRKYQITLGPPKTKFGFREAQFFGFRIDKEGSHLALKHLDPIRNLVPPTDIHELRRVLGLFVVSRKYIRDYAMITRPMTDLLRGKALSFAWGEKQQEAFDCIREKLLQGVHVCAPDFTFPFHLATDASEDGKGGVLYQLLTVPLEQQYPYCPKLHSPDNQSIIFFLSKTFSETERLKPPFYLEGDALLWSTFKCKYYALSSPYPLHTYSDHLPLNWMSKTEKGPISSFIIERLSEIETIHQYIPGRHNAIPDSCSRFPMLGLKMLATRGYANSIEEVLKRLPIALKAAKTIHFHGGKHNDELRAALKDWVDKVGALTPLNPARSGTPLPADLAVMTPRCEVAPVILAVYLLSDVPFALLLPVDLLDQTRRPGIFSDARLDEIARRLEIAGKIVLLEAQMVWVVGNLPGCRPVEIFSNHLRTPAPITGFRRPAPGIPGAVEDDLEHVEGAVPRTLEAWIHAQRMDEDFPAMLELIEHKALQNDMWIFSPPDSTPSIIVPLTCQELLVRDSHDRMFHLAHAKVYALLRRSYYWPTQKRDVRKWLEDCPACEVNKARQNTAHGLFSALPVHAPRARWCMDFQGQGKALTGECEALALIDPTSRYVVVIPLKDREATTWLQPFLDRIVFTFGAPDVLHSDAAPEFLSEALDLLAQAAEIQTTTTLAHNARGNGTIEVFWRFWNRCMRMLPDDHYCRWPNFAQRIAFAYNTASHDSIAFVTPFEVQHGAPARNALLTPLLNSPEIDEDKELCLPGEFAAAVAVSTRAFYQLAKTHDDFVRNETAARLNERGQPKTFKIGDKVKVRVPPTALQMEATGRRAKHITAWRGPCTVIERISNTAYVAVDDVTRRRYERVISNLLPYRAQKAKANANAAYNAQYSAPFTVGEFIAIRDDPTGPFYVAKVELIFEKTVTVHYYGCTGMMIDTAIFKPCWHMVAGDDIVLQWDCPDWDDDGRPNFVAYSGTLDLRDIHTVLVARNLEFTKANKLRYKSVRALSPFQDQLFRFER